MENVLKDLADRIEALTGPDREVDAEIARTVYADNCRNPDWECGYVLAYTASLDAAMTLVPTKPFPELRPGEWWWSVDSLGCDAHVAYENHDAGIPEYSASAATPALALCAAALRALPVTD